MEFVETIVRMTLVYGDDPRFTRWQRRQWSAKASYVESAKTANAEK
ncbi:hypothetical protein [Sporisorium scitamineum]|uniref:Uncharacterized protein n=1 Tax=Sporisorium scitamineum TaxID=49012 RepID=A0A0F7RZF3_9BASI|nr:hypothetical protein [Sporisorium scitamineum]